MATPSFAAGAYASIQGMGAGNLMRKPVAAAGGSESGGPDFGAMIGKALAATADSGRKADAHNPAYRLQNQNSFRRVATPWRRRRDGAGRCR